MKKAEGAEANEGVKDKLYGRDTRSGQKQTKAKLNVFCQQPFQQRNWWEQNKKYCETRVQRYNNDALFGGQNFAHFDMH